MTSVNYAHDRVELGAKHSDCHKCGGTGMITSGLLGAHQVSEPCRRCNSAGFGGNWCEVERRFMDPDQVLANRSKSADDILFGSAK